MKKLIGYSFLLIVILVVYTVPKHEEYLRWLNFQMNKNVNTDLANLGKVLPGDGLEDNTSYCSNYLVFTLCETNFTENDQITVLGLLNNFKIWKSQITTKAYADPSTAEGEGEGTTTDPSEGTTDTDSQEIRVDDHGIPRLYIQNKTGGPLNKYVEWIQGEQDIEMPVKLTDGKASLKIAKSEPIGTKISILYQENEYSLDFGAEAENVFSESGDLIDTKFSIQATTHDFNQDGQDEVIIAVSNGLDFGQVWVYAYTMTSDAEKSPYQVMLTSTFKHKVFVNEGDVTIPSNHESSVAQTYSWKNNKFSKIRE